MSTEQSVPQPKNTAADGGRHQPPWMSMPGAPTRPNFAAFASRMSTLNAERRKRIDEIKALQSSIQGGGENRVELDTERAELRQRLNELDTLRRTQAQLRTGKNSEIVKIRQQRREAADKLRELQNELGGMRDIREIDAAIDYIMKKMETSGGGLASERRTVKRLHQLEEAKALLMELQPLSERIQEAEEREVLLQQEYREIHERIGVLNKEFDDQLGLKRVKDQEARSTGSSRAEVYRKCDEIRVHVHALDDEVTTLRAEHNKATEAWDSWCVEARAKYQAKIEAEREARHRALLERKNAVKNAQKLARAKRCQNPYELEVNACDTLVQYIMDMKRMTLVEEEERRRREAAASFDPAKAAPAGSVVLNDSKWTNAKPLNKAARKQQDQQKKLTEVQRKAAAAGGQQQHAHVMQHPEDKMRLFQLVNQTPPLSLAAVDEVIASLSIKRKEYESHVQTGEPQLSSSDTEGDGDSHEDGATADDANEKEPATPAAEAEDATVPEGDSGATETKASE